MQKHTKKALILSVLSLVLCVSMLVGTTFAWFTDSVTTGVNTIQSGTLDVDMVKPDGSAIGDKLYFRNAQGSSDILWEPGAMFALDSFKIVNKGNLALQYALYINGLSGDAKLLEAIDFYVTIGDVAYANVLANGTALNLFNATNVKLLPNTSSEKITLWGKMKEEAGNEYQGLFIDGISITVLATQVTEENDSFDNQYDKDATYANIVKTEADLAVALRIGGLIELADDITVDETLTVPAGVVATLDLNGKTITGTKGRDVDGNRIHVLVNNGTLTVNDGTIKSAGNDGGSAICNNAGANLTVNGVTLYGAPQSDPVYEAGVQKPFPSYAVNNYGKMVVNGATVKSYHGAIATGGNGNTVINDADIDVGLGQSTGITSYAIYSYEDAQVTVNGGKFAFTKQEIYVNGGNTFCELGTNPIIINGGNYIGTSFSTGAGREYVINAGTFDKNPTAYAKGQVVDNGNGTWTVKPYEVSTADELKNNLANGKPVVLKDDIALSEKLTVNGDAYIDGNNKALTYSGQDRAIDVPKTAANANVTIKNLNVEITAGYCQRGINYNTNGTLILDNVKLTGSTKATYGINLPSSSSNATVEMKNCDITANIALNVWGQNAVINVTDCNLSNYDNTDVENYTTVKLNNDGTTIANGTVITITGGSVTAKDQDGNTCAAISNSTLTGSVVISDSTVVEGFVEAYAAVIRYRDGNGNLYNEFYGATTLQRAVDQVAKDGRGEIYLLTDVTVDTLNVSANVTVYKNGHTLTVGATTGSGALNIVD